MFKNVAPELQPSVKHVLRCLVLAVAQCIYSTEDCLGSLVAFVASMESSVKMAQTA
jgi:hypothetical protein